MGALEITIIVVSAVFIIGSLVISNIISGKVENDKKPDNKKTK